MKKLLVALFTVIAIMTMTTPLTFAENTGWLTVKDFDALATEFYRGKGMVWCEVTFTPGDSTLLEVYCDDERIDYLILKDDEWKVEDQTIFISKVAYDSLIYDVEEDYLFLKEIANSAPTQTVVTLGKALRLGEIEEIWISPDTVFSIIPGSHKHWKIFDEHLVMFCSDNSLKALVICKDDELIWIPSKEDPDTQVPLLSSKAIYFAFE